MKLHGSDLFNVYRTELQGYGIPIRSWESLPDIERLVWGKVAKAAIERCEQAVEEMYPVVACFHSPLVDLDSENARAAVRSQNLRAPCLAPTPTLPRIMRTRSEIYSSGSG